MEKRRLFQMFFPNVTPIYFQTVWSVKLLELPKKKKKLSEMNQNLMRFTVWFCKTIQKITFYLGQNKLNTKNTRVLNWSIIRINKYSNGHFYRLFLIWNENRNDRIEYIESFRWQTNSVFMSEHKSQLSIFTKFLRKC